VLYFPLKISAGWIRVWVIFSGVERSLKNMRLAKRIARHWTMTRKKRISPGFSYGVFPAKEIPSSLKFDDLVKRQRKDDFVKSSRCKARKN